MEYTATSRKTFSTSLKAVTTVSVALILPCVHPICIVFSHLACNRADVELMDICHCTRHATRVVCDICGKLSSVQARSRLRTVASVAV